MPADLNKIMPNYKLIYFNVRGRAELSRLIMHCAQVPFEDERIEHSDWPAIKQGLNFHLNFFLNVIQMLICPNN